MLYLFTYDVNTTTCQGRRRLIKVAKTCSDYGIRVQNSVFECSLDAAKYVEVKSKLLKIIDENEDSLRIYSLGNKYIDHIEVFGCKQTFDLEGDLIL